ncbi:Ubiquinone biosynthesis accessory factor UbiJ [Commensalibacter sp. Nvir]|uniref:ubiquinone anaerobic biosynthesis accessory factor UbiT n=1 Tax=Commensalibacter sp. Nvir TaxID=3069817 RepID=UPI002D414775|nr:Ubiquinone biosynthesis accessory factor UbiJ [Commensalibacter sp. Nvir]
MRLIPPTSTVVSRLPLPLFSIPAQLAFSHVLLRHPKLFDRLGEHLKKTYAFILSDLPLCFVIKPEQKTINVCRKGVPIIADCEIEGPFSLLLSLAEGRLDADALFFSRDILVTGDMEAMVALRNTLDDNDIDLLHDFTDICGPFAPLMEKIALFLRNQILKKEKTQWN